MLGFNDYMTLAEVKDTSVMILPWPKMQKMGLDKYAPEEARKGAYLDASKFDFSKPNFEEALLNNKFYMTGSIIPGYFDDKGVKHPPQFNANGETDKFKTMGELKTPGSKLIKINMITNQGTNKKWKWHKFARGYRPEENYYQITSVQAGEHHFCLKLFIWVPFMLQNYKGGEPRNRPTTYGTLSFGKVIGEVVISGNRPRELYDTIAII